LDAALENIVDNKEAVAKSAPVNETETAAGAH
jgi:hypothetical protein